MLWVLTTATLGLCFTSFTTIAETTKANTNANTNAEETIYVERSFEEELILSIGL
ncbi:MAG: hypothetical protein GY804_14020 [Alphaproteobacteria bacterium]|nr:hypothetical protein [Alphaproteobacteria bacterium]